MYQLLNVLQAFNCFLWSVKRWSMHHWKKKKRYLARYNIRIYRPISSTTMQLYNENRTISIVLLIHIYLFISTYSYLLIHIYLFISTYSFLLIHFYLFISTYSFLLAVASIPPSLTSFIR